MADSNLYDRLENLSDQVKANGLPSVEHSAAAKEVLDQLQKRIQVGTREMVDLTKQAEKADGSSQPIDFGVKRFMCSDPSFKSESAIARYSDGSNEQLTFDCSKNNEGNVLRWDLSLGDGSKASMNYADSKHPLASFEVPEPRDAGRSYKLQFDLTDEHDPVLKSIRLEGAKDASFEPGFKNSSRFTETQSPTTSSDEFQKVDWSKSYKVEFNLPEAIEPIYKTLKPE